MPIHIRVHWGMYQGRQVFNFNHSAINAETVAVIEGKPEAVYAER